MRRAAIPVAIGLLAGLGLAAVYAYAPRLGIQLSPALVTVFGAAVVFGCTVALVMSLAMTKAPQKVSTNELFAKRLSEIDNMIRLFPTADAAKELFIRPETRHDELDPVRNPGKYASKSIIMRLRGGGDASEPFNPVKLREIFGRLAGRENFEHVLLYNGNKDFVAYIPAWYARLRFVDGEAESRIARAITDVYSQSLERANLRDVRGANKTDVISDRAKMSEAMDRFVDGVTLLVVLKNNSLREPVGFLLAERVFEAIKNGGVLEPIKGPPRSRINPVLDAPMGDSNDLRA